MSFSVQLRRALLQTLGLEGDEPWRMVCDIALGAVAAVSAIILLALSFESAGWSQLKTHGTVLGLTLFASILLAKQRILIILGVIVVIGARGLLAALLYGYWAGLIAAAIGGLALVALFRLFRDVKY